MDNRKLSIKYTGKRNAELDNKIKKFLAEVEFENEQPPFHVRYKDYEQTVFNCEFIGKTEKVWR